MSRLWGFSALLLAAVIGCDGPDPLQIDLDVVNVVVAPGGRALTIGDSMQLTAYPKTEDGTIVGGVPIVWNSDNEAIASVRANGIVGVVEAKSVGTTRIRAQVDGIVGEVTVTVTERILNVASIEITAADSSLRVGGWMQLEAVLRAADGTVVGGRAVTWTSSSAATAPVTSIANPLLAVVSGNAAGEVVITATSEGVQGTKRVRVLPPLTPVGFVSIMPPTLGAWVDQRLDYAGAARVLAANGLPLEGRTVTWSASDSTIARVQPNGEVRALRAGRTQIRATSEGVTGQATLVVFEQPAGNTMQFGLTNDWWDGEIRIAPTVKTVAYTDTRGVVKQVGLFPESATLTMDKPFTGYRWTQVIVLAGYADDGTGNVRRVVEQRIEDRGTYTFDMTSDRPMVFTSEISQSQVFTGRLRQFEFHMQQAIGTSATQEYRYRLPN